jgi:hypothetical protein
MGKHRAMLAAATLAHVRGEAQGLLRELGTVLEQAGRGRRVRQATAERYLEEARRLGHLVEEYRRATRDRLVEAGSDLDLLREQVVALMGAVEE